MLTCPRLPYSPSPIFPASCASHSYFYPYLATIKHYLPDSASHPAAHSVHLVQGVDLQKTRTCTPRRPPYTHPGVEIGNCTLLLSYPVHICSLLRILVSSHLPPLRTARTLTCVQHTERSGTSSSLVLDWLSRPRSFRIPHDPSAILSQAMDTTFYASSRTALLTSSVVRDSILAFLPRIDYVSPSTHFILAAAARYSHVLTPGAI
ncbi:hypothetical protein C8J57DRAFT_113716 [Mycena rebaudengoi]|nr:hypothetical protein C8J57DRAFT_113716 [Mycena rebaudengoi]